MIAQNMIQRLAHVLQYANRYGTAEKKNDSLLLPNKRKKDHLVLRCNTIPNTFLYYSRAEETSARLKK